jgi:hypothetical protein
MVKFRTITKSGEFLAAVHALRKLDDQHIGFAATMATEMLEAEWQAELSAAGYREDDFYQRRPAA